MINECTTVIFVDSLKWNECVEVNNEILWFKDIYVYCSIS